MQKWSRARLRYGIHFWWLHNAKGVGPGPIQEIGDCSFSFERLRSLLRKPLFPAKWIISELPVTAQWGFVAIFQLASDFPRLWRDVNTPDRERKRMVRLLLEDVTLLRGEQITLHLRFRGGASQTLVLPLPQTSWQRWTTSPEVVTEIDRLLDHHTHQEIADLLNQHGFRSGKDQAFTCRYVARIQREYSL